MVIKFSSNSYLGGQLVCVELAASAGRLARCTGGHLSEATIGGHSQRVGRPQRRQFACLELDEDGQQIQWHSTSCLSERRHEDDNKQV